MLLGQYVFKLSTDDLFGVVSGAAGNPAILSYANRALPSDRVDVAYATIFPSMTILKIICVQVAIGLLIAQNPVLNGTEIRPSREGSSPDRGQRILPGHRERRAVERKAPRTPEA